MTLLLQRSTARLLTCHSCRKALGDSRMIALRYYTSKPLSPETTVTPTPAPTLSSNNDTSDSQNQQQNGSSGKRPFKWSEFIRTGEFLTTVIGTGCTVIIVSHAFQDKSKYSVEKKHKVVEEAMLSPISIEPLKLPELHVKDQANMMRELVFSNEAQLVLIEGAQGSGKSTLVKKLLNERIAENNVPCYYWSLKNVVASSDITAGFLELFGIAEGLAEGHLAKEVVKVEPLRKTLKELKEKNGAPSVFVLDDAQRLFLKPGGDDVALFLQECYCDGLLTVIFTSSQGSCLRDFQKLSGYRARLKYMSLPSIPDEEIKAYIMGPLNKCLKDTKNCQPMTDEMADWFVAHFGGNFTDMKSFVDEVLQKKEISRERFLKRRMEDYDFYFMPAWKDPVMRAVLDDLLRDGRIKSPRPYTVEALESLLQNNIIARRADDFTWHKRLVRVAYENFVQDQKNTEEEQKKIEEEKQKKIEAEKQKKIEAEKQKKIEEERLKKRWYQLF